jgi:hypothetical protein
MEVIEKKTKKQKTKIKSQKTKQQRSKTTSDSAHGGAEMGF